MKKSVLLMATIALSFSNMQAQTVIDYDGNLYNTVTIGTQVWMKENLQVTHYQNGDSIPNIGNTTSWSSQTSGALCDFNNSSLSSSVYGKLYNWYAATDFRNACPLGWHVSTDAEWNVLAKYLDNTVDTTAIGWSGTDIGGKLKETGTLHWELPNTGATNSSDFTALPGGYRNLYGTFYYQLKYGYWWSTKSNDAANAWKHNLNYDNAQISRSYNNSTYKVSGFSIRCVKDDITTKIDTDNTELQLKMYPNPAVDRITIETDDIQEMSLTVCNLLGQIVLQTQWNDRTNSIDISDLLRGIYIIKVSGNDWRIQRKLIKE